MSKSINTPLLQPHFHWAERAVKGHPQTTWLKPTEKHKHINNESWKAARVNASWIVRTSSNISNNACLLLNSCYKSGIILSFAYINSYHSLKTTYYYYSHFFR